MTYALIAHTLAASTNGGISATTASINTTGASLLVILVTYYNTLPTSITDSYSNTFTLVKQQAPGGHSHILYMVASPITGASHTFSVSSGAATYPVIAAQAWSGSLALPLDQVNGSNTNQPGSITPTVNNELIVISGTSTGTISAAPAGYTVSDSMSQISGQNVGGAMAYQVQTAATTTNPIWTGLSNSSIASFQPFIALTLRTIQGVSTIQGIQSIQF